MLNVFFTTDVEVWCGGWRDIDAKFPDAFQRYVYGRTSRGDYALPFQLRLLAEHGHAGVFFVEPLFAARFGLEPLREIVGLILAAGQEVQLHLHTEWVDEASEPLLPNVTAKRQHLRHFSESEQAILIAKGHDLLRQAGAPAVNAFRAGSFAFNRATLAALSACGIAIDSSYNATRFGPDSGVGEAPLYHPCVVDGVVEYPMSVFREGSGKLRHAQLTACSYRELERLLWDSLERGAGSVVLLSHNFELMNSSKDAADPIAVRRFVQLCDFLARNRASFVVRGFAGLDLPPPPSSGEICVMPAWLTGLRKVEQLRRRLPIFG